MEDVNVRVLGNHEALERILRLAKEREARLRAYEAAWSLKWDRARIQKREGFYAVGKSR